MSQKASKRNRKHTDDEVVVVVTQKPQPEMIALPSPPETTKSEQNGAEPAKELTIEPTIITRSRSTTPQIKKVDKNKKCDSPDEAGNNETTNQITPNETESISTAENGNGTEQTKELDEIEVDSTIVSDEPDPELQFDENSDLESGKGSPVVLSRCKTRRSQIRHVPTPKTPKLCDSPDHPESNLSTKVEVGSDSTRLDFTTDGDSFLESSKNQSVGETLRSLTARRCIRPISERYTREALKDRVSNNSTLPLPKTRPSVEPVVLKRKRPSEETDGSKRFKTERRTSTGLFSAISSPFRHQASSTPKLTGYKDTKLHLEEGGLDCYKPEEIYDKKWCSIM